MMGHSNRRDVLSIESSKMNCLDPETYLRDVLARIADHPINRIGERLPWTSKPSG